MQEQLLPIGLHYFDVLGRRILGPGRFLRWSLLMGAGFAPLLSSAAEPLVDVPGKFRGEWAENDAQCARGALSDTRLTLTDSEIELYASKGRILAVASHGENSLALIYEASGEGETWLEARQFELSEDGSRLIEFTGRRLGMERIRCPGR